MGHKSRFYERRAEIEQVQLHQKISCRRRGKKTPEVQRENAPILRLDKLGDSRAKLATSKGPAKLRDLEERGRIDAAEMRKRINALKERECADHPL